ncbi:MAG TPA: hypothetical protein VGG06_09055 [Thermoanaerobaculia bacterium]|jgi:hypothetical protein
MAIEINHIPHHTLRAYNARRAVLLTSEPLGDRVLMTTSGNPATLHETTGLEALAECRRKEKIHAICMTVLKLDAELIAEATSELENRYRIISELDMLLDYEQDVYVAYAVTHYNPGQKPLGPLTINIGGDCYRTGRAIKDLQAVLDRTRDLAEAMLKKAVMIFPDVPALHGGKKGEWIVLGREGRKVTGLSEEAIIAVGSAIIPKGIRFLNLYKEAEARRLGICDAFPERDYVRPDSGSPDVLSGVYWRGERPEKYINMCDAWSKRGEDMSMFTCLPPNLGGTLDSSSRPTGYGVATTTVELARRYFERQGRKLEELRWLLEAAGGVGRNTVEALVQRYGVPPEKITVVDRNDQAANHVREKYLVQSVTLRASDFYEVRLPEEVRKGERYDVWINNGEGDNTRPDQVDSLLAAGVRVFTGGANNFLHVGTQQESLRRIFAAGGWTWPDPATSGGGWTLAVIGILARSQGRPANTHETQERILDIITSRNAQLVADVLDRLSADAGGADIWASVERLIGERVEKTLSRELTSEEIFRYADTTRWNLP